jgi:PAS domain S-box-containing protein
MNTEPLNIQPSRPILVIGDSLPEMTLLAEEVAAAELEVTCQLIHDSHGFEAALRDTFRAIVVCDSDLSAFSPSHAVPMAKAAAPHTPLLIVSDRVTLPEAVDLMRLGAQGVVSRQDQPRLLTMLRQELERHSIPADVQQAFNESEEKYRIVLSNISDAVFVTDPDGAFTFICPNVSILFGYSEAEIAAFGHIHKLLGDDLFDPAALEEQGEIANIERTLVDKHGQPHQVLIGIKRIALKKGTHLYTCHDISERNQIEAVLREREKRLESLLENLQDVVWTAELPSYQISYLNPIAETIYGRSPTDFYKHSNLWLEAIYPDDAQRIQESANGLLLDGIRDIEYRIVRPDGAIRWLHDRAWLVKDADGTPLRMEGIASDITAQKQSELELRTQNAILQQSHDLIAMSDFEGKIVFMNQGGATLMGSATPESYLGKAIADFHLPEDAQYALTEALPQAMQTGYWRGENRLKTDDGHLIDVDQTIFTIRDEQGHIIQAATIMSDITERKKVQDALRENEAKLQAANEQLEQRVRERTAELEKVKNRIEAIFNHSGDGILMLSLQEGIQQANYTFEEIFGLSESDYLGKRLASFFSAEDTPKIEAIIQQVADSHQMQHVETRIRRPVDGDMDVELNIAPVNRTLNTVTNLVCIIHNITERKQAENALRLSEERLTMMLQGTRAGTWDWHIESGRTQINARWAEILGYTLDTIPVLSGDQWAKMVHPDDLARVNQILDKHFAQETAYYDCELRMKHQNGEWVWVWDRGMVVERTLEGKPLRIVGTLTDVSERKAVENAIAEERNLLRTVIDAVPDFIFVKDKKHRMLLNNTAHAQSFGKTPTQAMGKTDYDLLPPELAEKFYADEENLFQSKQPILNIEEHSLSTDGRGIWALTTKVPLHNLHGELIGLVGITRDVSEIRANQEALRRSEQQVRESQRMLQLILDTIPVRVFWKNRESVYMGCNNLFAQDAGLANPDQVVGKRDTDLIWSSESSAAYRASDLRVIESDGHIQEYEELQATVSGQYIDVRTTKQPLRGADHEIIGVLGVYVDITLLKRAEENLRRALEKEMELSELKTRFVSIASHEFRTPLAAIMAITDTLTIYRDKMLPEQVSARLDKIRQQVNHMKVIMEDVLQLSSIQTGKLKYQPVPGNMNMLCRDIVEEFDSQPQHHERLRFKSVTNLELMMFDPHLMRQVVNNLLSNALKYSPIEKQIRFELDQNHERLTLKVSDEGIGIPPDDLNRLFEPFHRAANVGEISGTGLGLSITKQVVELHGGSILAESEVGKGTTITIVIPVKTLDNIVGSKFK